MHNIHYKGQLLLAIIFRVCFAIALSVTSCDDVIRCRRKIAFGNCIISVIQLSPSLGSLKLKAVPQMGSLKPQQLLRFIITVLVVLLLKGERFIGPLQKIAFKGNVSFSLFSSEIFFWLGKSVSILISWIERFTSHSTEWLFICENNTFNNLTTSACWLLSNRWRDQISNDRTKNRCLPIQEFYFVGKFALKKFPWSSFLLPKFLVSNVQMFFTVTD